MTDTELSSLESAAKAATPGPWRTAKAEFLENADIVRTAWKTTNPKVCDHILFDNCCFGKDRRGHIRLFESSGQQWRENAAFIAAANPAAILSLVAELRQAKAERDWLADYIATLTGKKSYNTKEHWIKAAKEATCQK